LGALVLANEELIKASPRTIFELFGDEAAAGWFFGAVCDSLAEGSVVRFEFPVDPGTGGLFQGTGRIVSVRAPHRIVIEHESPWRGRVTCTITSAGEYSRVRLVAEVPEEAMRWLLRRRGVSLAPEAQPGEVPVGLLLSQSGPASIFVGASEQLARLAIEEINAEGPPGGRPLRLVVGDDSTSPAVGVGEARRLVEEEGCRVVITNITSATFEAVRPVIEKTGALLVFSIMNEGGPTGTRLFRLGERPSAQMAGVVPRLMAATGGRHWYLAGDDYCWPRAMHRCAHRIVHQAGGTVVGERFEPLGTRDFAPVLEAIERSGAELVLSTFVGADEVEFERQFHQAGLRERCRTFAPILDDATREHVGDRAAAGVWTVFGYFEGLPTEANRDLLGRYRARFGPHAPPPSGLSESVYETVHLVAGAARQARSWEPTDVGRILGASTFDGPRGRVRVDGPDHFEQHLYLAEAVPGGFAIRDALC
jgi:branched-chain amino acid transport system substrate-binding protein